MGSGNHEDSHCVRLGSLEVRVIYKSQTRNFSSLVLTLGCALCMECTYVLWEL